jgi:hypothetical protein
LKWFKHDSDATTDAKMRKLIIRHGAVGYAVYFHCLELIANSVSDANITFELEHDSEIIADNLKVQGTANKSSVEVVEDIMRHAIELGLFDERDNRVFCFKLLKRIDTSMTSSHKMREMITLAKENHDSVMTLSCLSHDKVMQDKTRQDKTIQDKTRQDDTRQDKKIINLLSSAKPDDCPQQEIIAIYHELLPELPTVRVWNKTSQSNLRSRWKEDKDRQSLDWWEKYFTLVNTSDFLTGKKTDWKANLTWLVGPKNFEKVMNGTYVNKQKHFGGNW